MTILTNKQWQVDLVEMLASFPKMEELAGTKVLITGATGLICSAVVDLFVQWNKQHDKRINVMVAGRNQQKMEARFGKCSKENGLQFVLYDAVSTENKFPDSCDYIIHGASNATPKLFSCEPVETMLSNFVGVKCLLDYAQKVRAKRLLYISSSEIYGQRADSLPFKEDNYGFVDLLNPRNSYPIGKRAAETLCASYASEYDVDTVIVRPGHIYGPTASEGDNRVSSQWAYAAAQGRDIIMKSDGLQLRSYCHCLDCASAILQVLLNGEGGQAYNISNRKSIISIRQMAQILAEAGGVRVKMELPTDAERKSYNPMNNSSLDSTKLEGIGWRGMFDAERGLRQTVSILTEMQWHSGADSGKRGQE